MLSSCYICRGDIRAQKMTVDFHWGKKVFVFQDVPTHICQKCGEKYFEAMVYHRMEKLSEIHAGPLQHPSGQIIQFGDPSAVAGH